MQREECVQQLKLGSDYLINAMLRSDQPTTHHVVPCTNWRSLQTIQAFQLHEIFKPRGGALLSTCALARLTQWPRPERFTPAVNVVGGGLGTLNCVAAESIALVNARANFDDVCAIHTKLLFYQTTTHHVAPCCSWGPVASCQAFHLYENCSASHRRDLVADARLGGSSLLAFASSSASGDNVVGGGIGL